jgi:hypothetical protein
MAADREPAEYVAQKLRDALAADARTGELGLDVHLVGERFVVRGTVGSDARRSAINDVARDVAPDVEIVNETDVKEVNEPGVEESIE